MRIFWGLIFLIAGTLCCGFSFYSYHALSQKTAEATARIAAIRFNPEDETYQLHLDFITGGRAFSFQRSPLVLDNKGDIFQPELITLVGTLSVGKTVKFIYPPNKPNDAVFAAFTTTWLPIILAAAGGLLMMIVGLILLFR